jgi:hypothetical protein
VGDGWEQAKMGGDQVGIGITKAEMDWEEG